MGRVELSKVSRRNVRGQSIVSRKWNAFSACENTLNCKATTWCLLYATKRENSLSQEIWDTCPIGHRPRACRASLWPPSRLLHRCPSESTISTTQVRHYKYCALHTAILKFSRVCPEGSPFELRQKQVGQSPVHPAPGPISEPVTRGMLGASFMAMVCEIKNTEMQRA